MARKTFSVSKPFHKRTKTGHRPYKDDLSYWREAKQRERYKKAKRL